MKSLTAYASEQQPLGFFRIFATPYGGATREITLFRGAPVQIGTVTTQDPFTEQTAQLTFPQITVFDAPGEGDLDWLVPNANIDIVLENLGGYDFDWRWEGYIASYSMTLDGTSSSFTTDLKGAFYGLDDYLAIPSFPGRPIPYEILIRQAFDLDQHPASLGAFRMVFPDDWKTVVPEFTAPDYLTMLKPWGVRTGDRWTGIAGRSTGSWEPLLTGFVQSMLTVMFAAGGSQWTIKNIGGRRPELYLRQIPDAADDKIIEITLGAPGVTLNGTRDYTQRAGVIYGSGQDDAGIAFANLQVSPDGRQTYFAPFAYSPSMWPRKNNPNYDPRTKPKETRIQFQNGVDEVSAAVIATSQYHRFYEPGIQGTITLTTDPRRANGQLAPRLLIRGGTTLRIIGLFGIREGVLAHVTQVSADFTGLVTTLTFDTKYRDQLTVAEVQARTKDALTPLHALQTGKYTNTINDLVIPWSTVAGSGIIPTPAKEFFNQKLPPDAIWPYERYTTQFPPSNPSYRPWYIEIGKTDPHNSLNNWSAVKRKGIATAAIPIRMGQAGAIRLTQLAAYDSSGHVLPVKFHLSLYDNSGVGAQNMPRFPGIPSSDDFPPYLSARRVDGSVIPTDYGTYPPPRGAQTHPFYKGGWEQVQEDGTKFPWGDDSQLPNPPPVVGWGNYYEPAGYSPGRFSKGAERTGLLNDDISWQWDLSQFIHTEAGATQDEYAGYLFAMIYCDDQDDRSVFFMGRLVRTDPGQQ